MTVQLDTNLLTRLAQPSHQHHPVALIAKRKLEAQGATLCIVPQNLYEFWAVATRPVAVQGLGLSVAEAKAEYDRLKLAFVLHLDTPALLGEWDRLIITHDCKGKSAHDARIVAAMNVHGAQQLLTFNAKDFTRYPGITLLDPVQVAAATDGT